MGRNIDKIIIHCSDSSFGDADTIDSWHRGRGWAGIGYHFVITNGIKQKRDDYLMRLDGLVQIGRDIRRQGAHCFGENANSIGVCLIGEHHFSGKQLYLAIPSLLHSLMIKYGLSEEDIYGHHDFNERKTCPNIRTEFIRTCLT